MLTPVYRGAFKKDRKLMKKRGKDMDKLTGVLETIANEQPLPAYCRAHALHGDWEGFLECHIENDWLLIYKINSANAEVLFDRTGTHADLF